MIFTLKCIKSLTGKPTIKAGDFSQKDSAKCHDPFAPPLEEDLVVEHNLTEKHSLIFNKFPVTKNHVLIITKDFEHQSAALNSDDMQAIVLTMKIVENGFIFYNCGKNSGASQVHKHVQCFPETNFPTKKLPVSLVIDK